MKDEWQVTLDYSVEIWFRIEKNKDGYPKSKEWEQLLARPILQRDDYFQIESVPFFLRNVSRGDVVKAKTVKSTESDGEERFEFDGVVDRGGHNTYRLLLKEKRSDDPTFTENELVSKGLAIEIEDSDFFAVDVPPSVDQDAIDDYLMAESKSGRWGLQDGYLHSIEIIASGSPT